MTPHQAAEAYAERSFTPIPGEHELIAKALKQTIASHFLAGDTHGFKRAMQSPEVLALVDAVRDWLKGSYGSGYKKIRMRDALAAFEKAKGET